MDSKLPDTLDFFLLDIDVKNKAYFDKPSNEWMNDPLDVNRGTYDKAQVTSNESYESMAPSNASAPMDEDEDEDGDNQSGRKPIIPDPCEALLFGRLESGESITVRVPFKPFVYLLPPTQSRNRTPIIWDVNTLDCLRQFLARKLQLGEGQVKIR